MPRKSTFLADFKAFINKGNVVDAFDKCNLKEEDFYYYDGHPNAKGYEKISFCISSIFEKKLEIK